MVYHYNIDYYVNYFAHYYSSWYQRFYSVEIDLEPFYSAPFSGYGALDKSIAVEDKDGIISNSGKIYA
jgi:hypothetical protein